MATLRDHRFLLLAVSAYVLAGFLTQWLVGLHGLMQVGLYSQPLLVMLACYLMVLVVGHALWLMVRIERGQSLLRAYFGNLHVNYLARERLLPFLIVLVALPPFIDAFASFKQAIPQLAPFRWDVTFMEWDYLLHGGNHPWELLQPLLAAPAVTTLINWGYNLWFFVMFTVVFWQAWSRDRLLRRQFLVSFVVLWAVAGTLLAVVFSSAGPCFFGRVTGQADPYTPLMAYLRGVGEQTPLWAVATQERLWDAYQAGQVRLVGGISAMPSMHVASAVLFALVAWRASRWLGLTLTLYAVVIQVGSVHLGWHYAIDGYFGAVVAWLVWLVVGWAARRPLGKSEARNSKSETNPKHEIPNEEREVAVSVV
ncbi:MAG: phosphatase PAP2 family protein [Gemmataceae bacterium]|nr:phosphatase PAP2 family protein [Gemmataceae bacterium]